MTDATSSFRSCAACSTRSFAAPDLLDALKMILQYDEAYGIDFKEWERDQLYAAIQKAEGP